MILLVLLLIPLVASALAALTHNPRRMEAVYLASAAGSFVAAVILAAQVLRSGPVSLADGFLYADHLRALVSILTAFVYLISAPYAAGYFRNDQERGTFARERLRK